ncbi:MAG TPA: GAF domain-containing sensor histidine kinase, partial [Myxococcota bacterium]
LPIILCGDAAPDLVTAATNAGVVVVASLPPAAELKTLWALLTGPLRRNLIGRTQDVSRAMGELCELGVDDDDHIAGRFGADAMGVIAELFDADVVSLFRVDDDGALRVSANLGLDDVIGKIVPASGLAAYVQRTGIARLVLGDATASPAPVTGTNAQARASMIVPVTSGAKTWGVLAVANQSAHALYTPRDLQMCTSMATLLGHLLARAETARHARELQQRLNTAERLTVLGELAAGVVHDIAAPLSAVRANNEILIGYMGEMRPVLEDNEGSTPALTAILDDLPGLLCETYEGLTTACAVITQMRQVVRLGSGGGGGGRGEEVDVSATVDSAVRMLRSRVPTAVVVLADDHCAVRGVPIELLQVMTNLITNANDTCVERRAMEQARGEVFRGRIEIAMRNVDDKVVISVADNGMGMTPDVLARMWEQLFTTKPAGVGTGLGMGVVRRIIREHGGEIDVSSTPGHGSVFTITLPRHVGAGRPRATDAA